MVDKPWFNQDCRFARQNYRKLKRNINKKSNKKQRDEFNICEKNYKKLLDNKIKSHRI